LVIYLRVYGAVPDLPRGALVRWKERPMPSEILVPALGESITKAVIARWLKQVGDTVVAGEPLVELETSKVNMEVRAPITGTLTEQTAAAGDTVRVGQDIGTVG
jgi:2-oxoglutarate dehydrogenase E2 component (dihydrolipoamide succinyltransferase)